jgi:MFS superfamily sulfate permease-like transporter
VDAPLPSAARNRFDLRELSGAFGDLGTLIPFVAAYIAVLKMDPRGVLLAFGIALVIVGIVYRTPFPVQPMKAIGAAAVTQAVALAAFTSATVVGATLVTGVLWLFLGVTGLATRVRRIVPAPAMLGVVLGLGFSFMLEGIRMMAQSPMVGAGLFVLTLLLLMQPRVPAMLVLLAGGVLFALWQQPGLWSQLAQIRMSPQLPAFAWPALSLHDLWVATLLLALPQLPLTFGNALVAVTAENNRLFPERPVSERRVAISTGLMNIGASAIGGVPMCHGAGGMAAHVRFGARTGGAAVMLGLLLAAVALLLGDSVAVLLRVFPAPVLGVMLFLAGVQLARDARDRSPEKVDRIVIVVTAAFAIYDVGLAVVFGIVAYHATMRGWLRL